MSVFHPDVSFFRWQSFSMGAASGQCLISFRVGALTCSAYLWNIYICIYMLCICEISHGTSSPNLKQLVARCEISHMFMHFAVSWQQIFCLHKSREPFWDRPSSREDYVRTPSGNIKIAASDPVWTEVKGGKWLKRGEHPINLKAFALTPSETFDMGSYLLQRSGISSISGFMFQTAWLGFFLPCHPLRCRPGTVILSMSWEMAGSGQEARTSWTVLRLETCMNSNIFFNQRLTERPFCNPRDTISPPESSKLKHLRSWDDGIK